MAEIPLYRVTLTLCHLCLSGAGGECHVPGCALCYNRAPDLPLWWLREYEGALGSIAPMEEAARG